MEAKHPLDGLLEPAARAFDTQTSIAISLKRLADEGGWKAASRDLIEGLADERDRTILLAALLAQAREYVADALDAHEHSDGRDLLIRIDAAIASASLPQTEGE